MPDKQGEGVHHGQDAQLLASRQLVMNKIHAPAFMRPAGLATVLSQLRPYLRFGVLFRSYKPSAL
jgi:hypothetical protein